jgi:Domain of unknown function (DUF1906)
LRAARLRIALVFQTTAAFMLNGFNEGVEDAGQAEAMADGLGITGRPIYFALDIDPRGLSSSQWDAVKAYLNGAASVIGRDRVGVYGGFKAIDVLVPTWAPWGWQTYAWSAGQLSGKANLFQYQNGVQLCGGEVDLCRSLTPDFGQWPFEGGFLMALSDQEQENMRLRMIRIEKALGGGGFLGTGDDVEPAMELGATVKRAVKTDFDQVDGALRQPRLVQIVGAGVLAQKDLLADAVVAKMPEQPPIDVAALAAAIVAAMPPGAADQAVVEAGVRAVIPEITSAIIAEIAS